MPSTDAPTDPYPLPPNARLPPARKPFKFAHEHVHEHVHVHGKRNGRNQEMYPWLEGVGVLGMTMPIPAGSRR